MIILAIDPGTTQSAAVVYNGAESTLIEWKLLPNAEMLFFIDAVLPVADFMAIEMVAAYGMPVGKEVFETCVWTGRFTERWSISQFHNVRFIYRTDVKLHLTHSRRSKDANVRQALLDKFGPGKELAIGKKATPGPLYGLSGDGWAALGVAVTAAESTPQTERN